MAGSFIRAYISFKRFDIGYVNYYELNEMARKAGLEHQMQHIKNPNEHVLNSIMLDDDNHDDIKKEVCKDIGG